MATAPSPDNLLLGRGKVYFNRFTTAGAAIGYRAAGNIETFELTTTDETKDRYESMTHQSSLYKQVPVRRTVSLKIKGDEFNEDNLALALMGDVVPLVQAGAPVVGEVLTMNATPGLIYRTALLGPIATVTVSKGNVALVAGTDYQVLDPNVGLIQLLTGAPGFQPGDQLTVGYTPTAYTAATGPKKVTGGTEGKIEGAVLFVGDPTTGPKQMVEVWHVTLKPDQAIGLIADDFATYGLAMTVLDDSANHPATPYYDVTYLPD